MIYIPDFRFDYILPDTVQLLHNDINQTITDLNEENGPISDDRRIGLQRRLADLHEQHITLQIRDTYLQVMVRVNRESGSKLDWTNPWVHLDPWFFDDKSNDQLLEEMVGRHELRKATKLTMRQKNTALRRASKAAEKWYRPQNLTDRYRAINGRLHEVRERKNLDGEIVHDVNPHPVNATRIKYLGEMMSVAGVLRILTNKAAKRGRPSKGDRFRAQVRVGSRVIHLGVYDTPEDRDAAVLNHRLGLGRANPAPNVRG